MAPRVALKYPLAKGPLDNPPEPALPPGRRPLGRPVVPASTTQVWWTREQLNPPTKCGPPVADPNPIPTVRAPASAACRSAGRRVERGRLKHATTLTRMSARAG
eukprot:366406-Chlamydomonas_euryale.AAC.9